MPAGRAWQEDREAARLEEQRQALLIARQASQTIRAMALLAAVQPRKTAAGKVPGSYGLKHLAENLAWDLGDRGRLRRGCVSTTNFIAAAINADFPICHQAPTSLNLAVGITARSLDPRNGMRCSGRVPA